MYNPQVRHITIDEQDVRFLYDGWMKTHVARVSQSRVVILDRKSVSENAAAGVFCRWVHAVAKEEVEDACHAAPWHDLLNGYETLLGGGAGGVGLVQKRDREVIVDSDEQRPSIWSVMCSIYPPSSQIPHLLWPRNCCLSGAMTPIFSFLLSRLLFEVSTGTQDVSAINKFGVGIAAIDGILLGTKYFIMETCGMWWVTSTAL